MRGREVRPVLEALGRKLLRLAAPVAVARGGAGRPGAGRRGEAELRRARRLVHGGPMILMQIKPWGCLKSDHNNPHLLAASFPPLVLRDASCSGAETRDIWHSRGVSPNPNPPQFRRLSSDTRIVSLGIGGNDIGFSEIIGNCASKTPEGHPCRDHYVVAGVTS